MRHAGIAAIACLLLTACGGGGGGLRDLSSDLSGPDEFSVLPTNPLELPATTALVPPTPGGTNRTDRTPISDAITALGGRPSAAIAGGIPSTDSALVAAASRNGVTPDIRQTLATEDAAVRARARTLSTGGLLGGDRYYRAYANQALDAYQELDRFRNLGVGVPSAPPAE